jgi:hypothetical protein
MPKSFEEHLSDSKIFRDDFEEYVNEFDAMIASLKEQGITSTSPSEDKKWKKRTIGLEKKGKLIKSGINESMREIRREGRDKQNSTGWGTAGLLSGFGKVGLGRLARSAMQSDVRASMYAVLEPYEELKSNIEDSLAHLASVKVWLS